MFTGIIEELGTVVAPAPRLRVAAKTVLEDLTEGASIAKDINIPHAELIIRKGYHNDVDSYSAFLEADKETRTGLAGYLKERKIDTVFVTGLATDFCVAWTALDARNAGFNVYVVDDACRGIDINGSVAKAWEDMTKVGVKKIESSDIA